MQTIISANQSIINTLGVQNNSQMHFRLLNYCRLIKYDNSTYLLYNNLTKELLEISDKEKDIISNKNIIFNTNSDFLNYLQKKWFIVPNVNNDKKLFDQLSKIFSVYLKNDNMHMYDILTTTDCNARCFYCFEHGTKKLDMSEKVAYDVADYIVKTASKNYITLNWFGGEPLFNENAIDIIIKKLTENGIIFSSNITTNGYLFDEKTVKKAKKKWNLKLAQITIDGTEEIYNKTKAYIYKNADSPYKRVMNNIKLLLDEKINVQIRLNLERYNEDNLYKLVDELYDNFGSHPYLSVYVHLLFENCSTIGVRSDIENEEMYFKLFKLEDYIRNKGFYDKGTLSSKLKTNACMADDDGAIMILPNGNLGKCEHDLEDRLIGTIYDDKIDKEVVSYWKERSEQIELCDTCQYYPQCVRLKHCVGNIYRECNETDQKNFLRELDRQIIKAYNRLKTKL